MVLGYFLSLLYPFQYMTLFLLNAKKSRILSKNREEGDIGVYITLVPKLFNNVFIFVDPHRFHHFVYHHWGMYINLSAIVLSL